ncbi:unnamed protein product [Cyclocybe aegerita]|uniref:F-box domain-containing protein n=1 Tax=Cyclocybe aegerita TaxID=1973307 RepID=A0A8S0VVV7_CYCAE|nr:unnamed protein product [Cyclocybe aegerita]
MAPPSRPTLPPPSKTRPALTSSSVSTSSRVRARKTHSGGLPQAINTNLSAHPRTDPANALSVLRKLLTSLPSRIGGCQYKLTAAEHALSLHLISIIDPFVYHGVRALAPNPVHRKVPSAPATGLTHQPTEILDAILFHVDSRKDLLNVALGCKRLHDVVFPRHFDYRVIRCKVSSISVWNHLIKNRSLARNVRKLEIIDERASTPRGVSTGHKGMLVPRGMLQRDTDLDSTDDEFTMHSKQERFLAAALLRMTGLREFKWSCIHSPISIANVWPTIMMRAPNLRSMEIHDNLVFAPRITVEESSDESSDESGSDSEGEGSSSTTPGMTVVTAPSSLLEMTKVVFRSTSHSYGTAKQPDLGHISAMLHQCANLRDLEITYVTPRAGGANGSSRARPLADEFLLYSRWASLTTLTLANLRCATSAAPAAFLAGHPNLEVLNIDMGMHSNIIHLSDGSLPRLREVKASKDIINAILECPCETARPLESLKGFKLSGHSNNGCAVSSTRSVSDATFLGNLKRASSTIRSIELVGWHEMEDIRRLTACVSSIQHLDVGRRLGAVGARQTGANEKGTTNGPVANIIEWTELLAMLPELTTMHGVKFFYDVASAVVGAPILSSSSPANGLWSTSNSNSSPISASASPTPPIGGAPSTFGPAKTQPQVSMMERSRMRKNDEIAGVLAWKCRKLRRVDHWEDGSGKVIVLVRDHGNASEEAGVGKDKVRWEVRRVKH